MFNGEIPNLEKFQHGSPSSFFHEYLNQQKLKVKYGSVKDKSKQHKLGNKDRSRTE